MRVCELNVVEVIHPEPSYTAGADWWLYDHRASGGSSSRGIGVSAVGVNIRNVPRLRWSEQLSASTSPPTSHNPALHEHPKSWTARSKASRDTSLHPL